MQINWLRLLCNVQSFYPVIPVPSDSSKIFIGLGNLASLGDKIAKPNKTLNTQLSQSPASKKQTCKRCKLPVIALLTIFPFVKFHSIADSGALQKSTFISKLFSEDHYNGFCKAESPGAAVGGHRQLCSCTFSCIFSFFCSLLLWLNWQVRYRRKFRKFKAKDFICFYAASCKSIFVSAWSMPSCCSRRSWWVGSSGRLSGTKGTTTGTITGSLLSGTITGTITGTLNRDNNRDDNRDDNRDNRNVKQGR